jgi:hypothetical protein
VTGLVHVARNLPHVELEAMLITEDSPNIPKILFNQIFKQYKEHEHQFESVTSWVEVRDNFFKDPSIRNRTSMNAQFAEHNWIRKIRLFRQLYQVVNRPLNIRINLKREIPIDPLQCEYVFVRTKKVCAFRSKYFKTSFSIVWHGKTPEECRQASPLYEIEVELIAKQIPNEVSDEEVAGKFLQSVLLLQGVKQPCNLKAILT